MIIHIRLIYVKITKMYNYFWPYGQNLIPNHWNSTQITFPGPNNIQKVVSFKILVIYFFIKTLKKLFSHMDKNKGSRVLKIHMGINTSRKYSTTKFPVNQPKKKLVMAILFFALALPLFLPLSHPTAFLQTNYWSRWG